LSDEEQKGELLVEFLNQDAVDSVSKALAGRFGDQVFFAP
jgi:hypothetical protein